MWIARFVGKPYPCVMLIVESEWVCDLSLSASRGMLYKGAWGSFNTHNQIIQNLQTLELLETLDTKAPFALVYRARSDSPFLPDYCSARSNSEYRFTGEQEVYS